MSTDAGGPLTCYRATCPGALRVDEATGDLACQRDGCDAALARDELELLAGEDVVGRLARAALDAAAGGADG